MLPRCEPVPGSCRHLYVAAGFDGETAVTEFERFDSTTMRWTLAPPLPTARPDCAVAVYRGMIYVLGGECPRIRRLGARAGAGAIRLTPALAQSSATARAAGRRPGACANRRPRALRPSTVAISEGVSAGPRGGGCCKLWWSPSSPTATKSAEPRALVVPRARRTGYRDNDRLTLVERFDGFGWNRGPGMLRPRSYFAVAVFEAKLYAIGGYDGRGVTNHVERYCARQNRWITVAPLVTPREGCSAVVFGGHIYAIGGFHDGAQLETVERFNGASWEMVVPMSRKRSGCAAVVFDRHLYVLGGVGEMGQHDTVERFDGTAWAPGPDMNCRRSDFGAAIVANAIVVAGGYNGSMRLADVEALEMTAANTPATRWQTLPPIRCSRAGCVVAAFDGAFWHWQTHKHALRPGSEWSACKRPHVRAAVWAVLLTAARLSGVLGSDGGALARAGQPLVGVRRAPTIAPEQNLPNELWLCVLQMLPCHEIGAAVAAAHGPPVDGGDA